MDFESWLKSAKNATLVLNDGTVFCLKDLFSGVQWNTLTRGQKLTCGKLFKNAVLRGEVCGINYIGKADNNSALYRKS